MLAPDICNFELKHTHYRCCTSSLDSDDLDRLVSEHSFNHSVCAVFPNTLNLPQEINESLNYDAEYYKVSDVPVWEFIEYVFIEAFIKKGELTCLSVDTLLDIDDCAAITPAGRLVLSLSKETFQELGVDKGPAIDLVKQKSGEKFQLHINLKEPCFKPGKKNYYRVYDRFKKINNLNMNFIISWEPNEEKVCPSSIAAYLNKRKYLVKECLPIRTNRIDYNLNIPIQSSDPEEMFEWFGLHALGAKEHPDPVHQEFLSSYTGTDDMDTVGQIVFIQWTGLFTTRKILKLLNTLRQYIKDRNTVQFIGFHVQGFDDAPVTWRNSANYYLTSGDNNYSFMLFPNDNAYIMKTT